MLGCGGRREVTSLPEAAIQEAELGTLIEQFQLPEQLTYGSADNGLGAFNPSGDRIVFQSNRDGRWQLYLFNLTDNSVSRLLESSSNDENPVWTLDGEAVVFVSDRSGSGELDRDIYLYSVAENVTAPLIASQGDDWYPLPVNEDSFIFLSDRLSASDTGSTEPFPAVYRSSLFAGGEPELVIEPELHPSAPLYLPDGRYVYRNRDGRLIQFDPLLNEESTLTPREFRCGTPAYDKARNWLAFPARRGEELSLYLYDLAARKMQMVTTVTGDARSPQFAPDGSWILYTQEVEGKFQMFRLGLTTP
ncbi:MAG: hypothetical protein V2A61_05185 [Calditrichota bacterium]